jgi:uncharacterized membrane-anchored protein YhcB (DUF1043 family)
MEKRSKKVKKGIESLKNEIEKHFEKLDKEIIENDEVTARYHLKEIDRSLIDSLEKKTMLFKENTKESKESRELLSFLRKKLEEYKKKILLE